MMISDQPGVSYYVQPPDDSPCSLAPLTFILLCRPGGSERIQGAEVQLCYSSCTGSFLTNHLTGAGYCSCNYGRRNRGCGEGFPPPNR